MHAMQLDALRFEVEDKICTDKQGMEHKGKDLNAIYCGILVGETGFVEWNKGDFENNGLNTARMKSRYLYFDIIISPEGHGIGRALMYRLFDELVSEGYNQFLVFNALVSRQEFYNKVFSELMDRGVISSFSSLKSDRIFYDVRM